MRIRVVSGMKQVVSLAILCAGQAVAQQNVVRGTVLDSGGVALADVDVGILAVKRLAKTDDDGRFVFNGLPAGEIELSFRRLGYEPQKLKVIVGQGSDTLRVVLLPRAQTLDAVEVERDRRRLFWIEEFHRRRINGMGTYISREDIDARRATRASDLLRNMPGIRFVAMQGRMGVRFVSAPPNTQRRDCPPLIWVDGQRAPGMEIDEITVTNIEGIELYNGPSTTPGRFSPPQTANVTCGTIVIWSRVPGH